MAKTSLYIFLLFLATIAQAQNKTYLYYLDHNLEIVPKEKATVIGKGRTLDATFQMQYFAAKDNRLLLVEEFKDSSLATLHGSRTLYHRNLQPAEMANYFNNKRNGLIIKWDSTGKLTDSSIFIEDKLQLEKKNVYSDDKGYLANSITTDKNNNTMLDIDYDSEGRKIRKVSFSGDKGIWTEYQTDGSVKSTDSVFTRKKTEAKFSEDKNAWLQYLVKNLDASIPTRNGANSGKATVVAQFIVETDGRLTNIKTLTHNGFGTEEEVMRILKRSPKWVPGTKYGRIVRAYRKQPITFQIQ